MAAGQHLPQRRHDHTGRGQFASRPAPGQGHQQRGEEPSDVDDADRGPLEVAGVGIVNVGGFFASLLVSWGIGVGLGAVGPGGYTPEAFQAAWTVQYAVWGFALVAALVARRRARRKLAAAGVVVPSLREVLARRHRRTGTG